MLKFKKNNQNGGFNPESSVFHVWRKACTGLLHRIELSENHTMSSRVVYLRALCNFLINIRVENGHDVILSDNNLSLCDRVAFACRFLPRVNLKVYLEELIQYCHRTGSIEGIVITGMEQMTERMMEQMM